MDGCRGITRKIVVLSSQSNEFSTPGSPTGNRESRNQVEIYVRTALGPNPPRRLINCRSLPTQTRFQSSTGFFITTQTISAGPTRINYPSQCSRASGARATGEIPVPSLTVRRWPVQLPRFQNMKLMQRSATRSPSRDRLPNSLCRRMQFPSGDERLQLSETRTGNR